MKALFFATAALALAAALSPAPATAQSAKPARTTSWAGTDRAAMPPPSAAPTAAAPHWEYRYAYDKHAAWRGHWLLVR